MKKISTVILLCLIVIISVFTIKDSRSQTSYINGKLINDHFKKCILIENPYNEVYSKIIDTCTVINNEFHFKLEIISSSIYNIYTDSGDLLLKNELIISPGDSLSIIIYHAGDSLSISGNGYEKNIPLTNIHTDYVNVISNNRSLLELDEYAYSDFITGWKNTEIKNFQKAPTLLTDSISSVYCRNTIDYFSAYAIYSYYISKRYKLGKAPELDSGFFNFESTLNFNIQIQPPVYDMVLEYYCKSLIGRKGLYRNNLNSSENDISIWFKIIKDNLTGVSRDYALFLLKDNFRYFHKDEFFNKSDSISEYFRENYYDPKIYSYFIDELKRIDSLRPGKKMKPFNLIDSSGTYVSLTNFNDIIVYVYIWATWCSPCIEKLADYNMLVSSFENVKNIAFINICIGPSTIEKWKTIIKTKNIKGNNLFVNDVCFLDNYYLNGVPKYFIINKNNIIYSLFGKGFKTDKEVLNILSSQ